MRSESRLIIRYDVSGPGSVRKLIENLVVLGASIRSLANDIAVRIGIHR